ncbi:MAG: hypothetical protein AMR96_05900 [Candidatus Adiutrix intracellularis]|nr:MAG: hypothetical protein AMR96_05900 [Candidatus Adiutrix intracellularis]
MSSRRNLDETRESLKTEFAAAGLELSVVEIDKFWRLHKLLKARNPAGDLTRIRGFYNLLYKHYIDSAQVAEFIEPQGLTLDLGTGAGFPGLVLAIRRPLWPLLLAEPRGRRLAFLEEAVEILGLAKVKIYPHKVGPRFELTIDNLITRDFEPTAATLARAAQFLPPGGRVFLMKGPGVEAELKIAAGLAEWANFDLESDRAYHLGSSGLARRLIVFRKKTGHLRPVAPLPSYLLIEIASRENLRYKSWLQSLNGRGLRKNNQVLVSGARFIREILADHPERAVGLIARRLSEVEDFVIPARTIVYIIRPELFSVLDLFAAGPPLLILNPPELPAWNGKLEEELTVFLPFQNPANLGAAIRTAAALGVRVVLLREAASPWHPKSLRASGPSVLAADLKLGPALAELQNFNLLDLLAFSPRGRDLTNVVWPDRAGFVFGLEGPGIPPSWPEERLLGIPMRTGVESLNAAAALAMALGVWRAQRS